jgi:hypothetical protein
MCARFHKKYMPARGSFGQFAFKNPARPSFLMRSNPHNFEHFQHQWLEIEDVFWRG